MSRDTEIDWLGIGVRFVCGTFLGAIAGLRIAASDGSKWVVLGWIAAGIAVLGTASAVFGDTFWEAMFRRRY